MNPLGFLAAGVVFAWSSVKYYERSQLGSISTVQVGDQTGRAFVRDFDHKILHFTPYSSDFHRKREQAKKDGYSSLLSHYPQAQKNDQGEFYLPSSLSTVTSPSPLAQQH
jgi:hypothetical protein